MTTVLDTTTKISGRAGVAANQIGVGLRGFSWNVDGKSGVIFNPKLVEVRGEKQLVQEGCLSVPGYYESVSRPERVRVRALDREGKTFEMDCDGLLAVCVQHEMDHLEGKLFVDYLSELKRTRIRQKLERDQRHHAVKHPRETAL